MAFANRLGPDTIGGLYAAALIRREEAESLYGAGFLLGALYLYGYAAEMVLGAAIIRIHFPRADDVEIAKEDRSQILRLARGRNVGGRPVDDPSHPIYGLACQLILERAELRLRRNEPGSPEEVEDDKLIKMHGQKIAENWRPGLRYQSLSPTAGEVDAVREAVEWLIDCFPGL